MMPGGDAEAYKFLQPIVEKVAAQVDDGPCVTYIGKGGAGACQPPPRRLGPRSWRGAAGVARHACSASASANPKPVPSLLLTFMPTHLPSPQPTLNQPSTSPQPALNQPSPNPHPPTHPCYLPQATT